MASNKATGEMVDGKKHRYWITYYASGLKQSEGNYVKETRTVCGYIITKTGISLVKNHFVMENMKVIYKIMLKPTCKNVFKKYFKLFLGVLMLGILFSCAKVPEQIIDNTPEFQKYRKSIVRVESKLGFLDYFKLFLGVLMLGILFSCAKVPEQIIDNTPEFQKYRKSIVRVESKLGFFSKYNGSGFFVDRNKVVTNIHVIAHPGPVYVKSVDKKTTWKVKCVAAFDVKNDLVILNVAGKGEALPFGNSDLVRGNEPIFAVGFPKGKYKVAEGTLHSIRDSDKWLRMIVHITSGSSGGPVLNSKGQVIGIQSFDSNSFSHAIPSNTVKVLLMKSESNESLKQWHKRELIRSYAYYVKGEINYDKEHYDKAIADLDEAIWLDPESIYSYFKRGEAKSNLGDYKDAISDYDKAIELNPENILNYISRGLSRNNLGAHKDAISDYDKVIKIYSQEVAAYINRGNAKQKLGDYKGAISDYDNAIELNSEYTAVAYLNRSLANKGLGQQVAAKTDFEKAMELDPDIAK